MEDIEITDNAQHESVRVAVKLKVVDVALPDIAEVTRSECDAPKRDIYSQKMATAEGIEGVSETHVVVCIP